MWVNCHQDRFNSTPSAADLPEAIYGLDLGFNQIHSLAVMDTMASLQMLNLEGNSMTHIEPKAFDNVSNLTSLDLSFNSISTFPEEVFTSLKQLKVLKLSSNSFGTLPTNIFLENSLLTELHLDGNSFRVLNPYWFQTLSNLQKLNLAKCGLFAVQIEAFHYTHSLQELDLSGNMFVEVPTPGLRSAVNLKKLILDHNPIPKITENSFIHMNNLEELQMCEMPKLVEVLAMSFADQENLKKLTMADNPHLVYVDRLAFYGSFNATWQKLKHVSLKGNRLSSLHEMSLPWCNLDEVDLSENAWQCDCTMAWVIGCSPVRAGPRCSEPPQFRHLEMHAIEKQDFVCQKAPHHGDSLKVVRAFTIFFGALILFFVGVAIALVVKRRQIVHWWSEKKRGTGSIYYVKANSVPGDSQVDF